MSKALMRRLEGYRQEHELTQEGLGEELGVGTGTISRWLGGQGTPNEANLAAIRGLVGANGDAPTAPVQAYEFFVRVNSGGTWTAARIALQHALEEGLPEPFEPCVAQVPPSQAGRVHGAGHALGQALRAAIRDELAEALAGVRIQVG